MKKISAVVFLFVIVLAVCKKDSTQNCSALNVTASTTEADSLRSFLANNSITATEDPRGFFYIINTAGTGDKPTVCDGITVNYTGKFLNGTQFDAANNASFNLGELIVGWQEALPLLSSGGSMTLYVPPSLAYGSVANGPIPANSYLMFTFNLLAVRK